MNESMKEWDEAVEKEGEWMRGRGWKQDKDHSWTDTEGTNHSCDAFTNAVCQYLKELGWKSILVLKNLVNTAGKPYFQGYFKHPVSGKVYFYFDAQDIALYYDNDDTKIKQERLTGVSKQFHEIFAGKGFDEHSVLHVDFTSETGYQLKKIDYDVVDDDGKLKKDYPETRNEKSWRRKNELN